MKQDKKQVSFEEQTEGEEEEGKWSTLCVNAL